ncbi:hypothetical protein K435DRAFT_810398 [Dendrothele bispora CBS 962.96]|uniref:Uncharacterized protein n=1 Tax=Dendrothele bispora (strain CBS 962.96) TaxID=1314807 RepID=A0A4S8KVG5_DENBC|nr:hypothetical protein K435DRAFT_810398 [Dendrothele bispora CBS 962.96]
MTLTSQNTTTEDVLSITLVMSIEYFFYGLYTVLFVLSIWVIQHVHAKRNTTTTSKTNQLHFTSMVVIFILTTSAIVLHSALNGQLILQNHFQDGAFGASSTPKLINSLGLLDYLQLPYECQIYRMYLIWGRRGRIVAVPLVISVLNHAGRIWKINKNARSIMELRSNINYHRTAMKIIMSHGFDA